MLYINVKAPTKLLTPTDLGIIGGEDNAASQLGKKTNSFSYLIRGHPSFNTQNHIANLFVQAPLGTWSHVLLYLNSVNQGLILLANNSTRAPLSTNRVTRTTSIVNITGSVDATISQSTSHTSENTQLTQLQNDTFIVPIVLFNTLEPPYWKIWVVFNTQNQIIRVQIHLQ